MFIKILKSKINKVVITQANLDYIGSITIDEELMKAANILEGEKVSIFNLNNGERLSTYVIKGKIGTGIIGLNGPSVRRMNKGDLVNIVAYARFEDKKAGSFKPNIIFPGENNKL